MFEGAPPLPQRKVLWLCALEKPPGGTQSLIATQGQKKVIVITNSHHSKLEECWSLVNALKQAWAGVEETDLACILKYVPHGHRELVIMVCVLWYSIIES